MAQAHRIRCRGIERQMPDPLRKLIEKCLRVVCWKVEDLSTDKAVFRSQIALNIGEAQDALRRIMGEHQCREPSHGMTHQMKSVDAEPLEDRLGSLNEKRNRDLRQIVADRLSTA